MVVQGKKAEWLYNPSRFSTQSTVFLESKVTQLTLCPLGEGKVRVKKMDDFTFEALRK
jgi:hypothetical protein